MTSRGAEFSLLLGCKAAAETLFSGSSIALQRYNHDAMELNFLWPNQPLAVIHPEIHPETDREHYYYFFENRFMNVLQDSAQPLSARLKKMCQLIFALEEMREREDWLNITELASEYSICDQPEQREEKQNEYRNLLLEIIQKRLQTSCYDYDVVIREVFAEIGVCQQHLYKWDAYDKIKESVMKMATRYDHVFENYLVNFILRKIFYRKDFIEALSYMVLIYVLVRFLCICHAANNGAKITDDIVLRAIMEIEQGFVYPGLVVEEIRKNSFSKLDSEDKLQVLFSWIENTHSKSLC